MKKHWTAKWFYISICYVCVLWDQIREAMHMFFVDVCFLCSFVKYCLFWNCDTVMAAVLLFWMFAYCVCVLFTHGCKYNETWCDCHTNERFSAIKPDSVRHFLHLKIYVQGWEYDSYCPFVRCVCSFDYAVWLGTFRFEFSSEFNVIVISIFIIWFCHLIGDFSFWIFLGVFLWFYFFQSVLFF